MATQLKVKTEHTPDEIAAFEAAREKGEVKVVMGVKEEPDVQAQGYYTGITCGRFGHHFSVWVPGPGVYWTVCPFCGNGSWTTVF